MSIRVRFAPSPTGHLHVGNVRTALFNWLFARNLKGTFILRIEDTDVERSRPEYERNLLEDLRWLELDWDEGIEAGGEFGPYRQTQRIDHYGNAAEELMLQNRAYYCFCKAQELEAERLRQHQAGQQPHYSGKCAGIDPAQAGMRLANGEKATVRLRVREGKVSFQDRVFGSIEVDTAEIGDFILLRSDGSAQYNFACVVDDLAMKITHVIRGEGHISNTPRQLLIYEALDTEPPEFAHLSTILGKDGSKLSKRHGATSLTRFRELGYLPESMVNYLALLGWSPREDGDEILAVSELIDQFDLDRVNRSPATFDIEKLNWVNRSHLKEAGLNRLATLAFPFLRERGWVGEEEPEVVEWVASLVDLLLKYVDKLADLPEHASIIFDFDPGRAIQEPSVREILEKEGAAKVIAALDKELERFEGEDLDFESYKELVMAVKEKSGQKGRELFQPIRIGITAKASGPELEQLVGVLDKGSRLSLPVRIYSVHQRVSAVRQAIPLSSR